MPLEVKKQFPDELIPKKLNYVWPGDSAVDLEKSDLYDWCDKGLECGLEYKNGMQPDVIELHPLTNSEYGQLSHLVPSIFDGDVSVALMAFRYSYRRCKALDRIMTKDLKIRIFERDSQGIRRLTVQALDFFLSEDLFCELPLQYFTAKFMDKIVGSEDNKDEQEDRECELRPLSFPYTLGAHILAKSFRR